MGSEETVQRRKKWNYGGFVKKVGFKPDVKEREL